MNIQFSLTVVVTGNSLEDVDNGLVEAAGQRLRARMLNPPAGPIGEFKIAQNTQQTPQPVHPVSPGGYVPPVAPTVQNLQAADNVATISPKAPGKRGPKPGSKRGPYVNGEKNEKSNEEKVEAQSNGEETSEEVAHASSERASSVSQAPRQESASSPQGDDESESEAQGAQVGNPTLDDAVNALSGVSKRYNIDKARSCLDHFKIARCRELTDENRQQFIVYCNGL